MACAASIAGSSMMAGSAVASSSRNRRPGTARRLARPCGMRKHMPRYWLVSCSRRMPAARSAGTVQHSMWRYTQRGSPRAAERSLASQRSRGDLASGKDEYGLFRSFLSFHEMHSLSLLCCHTMSAKSAERGVLQALRRLACWRNCSTGIRPECWVPTERAGSFLAGRRTGIGAVKICAIVRRLVAWAGG